MQSKKDIYINYDFIIIGAGISGLYTAYNIKKKQPLAKILLLESAKKVNFGGRLGNKMFHGVSVVKGAGVVRKNKDYLLIKLMNELNIPYNEFIAKYYLANNLHEKCHVKKIITYLKHEYEALKLTGFRATFKEFALPLLGNILYKDFIVCAGYTDFEKEDIHQTLYNYGFDDNYSEWTGLSISWKLLLHNLADKVGWNNIIFSSNVIKIKRIDNEYMIYTLSNTKYKCNKVIIATTINSVLKLLPKEKIYRQIHSQPFLRIYGKFSKGSIPILKEYIKGTTLVYGPLHKIIPLNDEKGVYMVAYTDNDGAKALKKYIMNTEMNRTYLCSLIEKALGIPSGLIHLNDILSFYWETGTHYYEPLRDDFKNRNEFIKRAQNPMQNMFIVGEMISNNQGWTDGALNSVHRIFSNIIKQ